MYIYNRTKYVYIYIRIYIYAYMYTYIYVYIYIYIYTYINGPINIYTSKKSFLYSATALIEGTFIKRRHPKHDMGRH